LRLRGITNLCQEGSRVHSPGIFFAFNFAAAPSIKLILPEAANAVE
jgi:hypothetical protein